MKVTRTFPNTPETNIISSAFQLKKKSTNENHKKLKYKKNPSQ